jgi:hypothetical protein
MKWSGDYRYNEFVSTAYIYATRQDGDITNGCSGGCGGKWNDDIAWWGLSAMYGGQLNGMSQVVTSATADVAGKDWLFIANYTLHLMMQQWDTKSCGGGIFWSRDRSSSVRDERELKSAITNNQVAHLGALIYNSANDTDALNIAKQTYKWTMEALVDKFYVFDGIIQETTGCQRRNISVCTKSFD